jgi:hypothetical protein
MKTWHHITLWQNFPVKEAPITLFRTMIDISTFTERIQMPVECEGTETLPVDEIKRTQEIVCQAQPVEISEGKPSLVCYVVHTESRLPM